MRPWKELVNRTVRHAFDAMPFDEPLFVQMVFNMPRPGYHFETKKHHVGELKVNAEIYHGIAPDLDNLVKAVLDALQGVLWINDSRVCQLYTEKRYTPIGEQPGVRLVIAKAIVGHVPDPTKLL